MVALVRSRLRIAIFGQNFAPEPSGNAPYTSSLARGLAHEHAVRVICSQPYYPEWEVRPGYRSWAQTEYSSGLRVDRKLHYVPRNPTSIRRLVSELTFGLRVVGSRWGTPDAAVLVSPSLFACLLVLPVARVRGVPTIVWVQDLYTRGVIETGQAAGVVARLVRKVESSVLRAADRVVVIHESFKDFASTELRVPTGKIEVIRNWSHLPAVRPLSDRTTVRRAMGWSDDDVVVVHAGNMGIKQGLENVIAAAQFAEDRQSAVHFVLIGGGSQLERLRVLARGIRPVQFVDSLTDDAFQPVLAAADILLVNEMPGVTGMSVPSKLTSYFSTGVPVIAATEPGSVTESEILASGGGVVVPAGDPLALVEAAESLASDPDRSAALGSAGRKFREQHLTQTAGLERFAELLASVLAPKT